jgi:hypothetical protein
MLGHKLFHEFLNEATDLPRIVKSGWLERLEHELG